MSKDELFDIEYDDLDYYGGVTRNLYKNIMEIELWKEKIIQLQTNTLLDVIKYTIVLEERIHDLEADTEELQEEED